jgi:hypothetical protein
MAGTRNASMAAELSSTTTMVCADSARTQRGATRSHVATRTA